MTIAFFGNYQFSPYFPSCPWEKVGESGGGFLGVEVCVSLMCSADKEEGEEQLLVAASGEIRRMY